MATRIENGEVADRKPRKRRVARPNPDAGGAVDLLVDQQTREAAPPDFSDLYVSARWRFIPSRRRAEYVTADGVVVEWRAMTAQELRRCRARQEAELKSISEGLMERSSR